MNQPKKPQFTLRFVMTVISTVLGGLVALCIPHAAVCYCVQAGITKLLTVENLQWFGEKLKGMKPKKRRRLPGKQKLKAPNKKS